MTDDEAPVAAVPSPAHSPTPVSPPAAASSLSRAAHLADLVTLRATRRTVLAGVVGGLATASGIALTATSGWLIVRAWQMPIILTLLMATALVRGFGVARPLLRYAERLISHDEALADLARRRTGVYAALVPLTPARLARRSRAEMLSGVVDDVTEVVDSGVRVVVPVVSVVVAGALAALVSAIIEPLAAVVVLALLAVAALTSGLALQWERRGQDELLAARAQVSQVSDLVTRQALEVRAIGGQAQMGDWLAGAHDRLAQATRAMSGGRAVVNGVLLAATGAAAVAMAAVAARSEVSAPVHALLVVLAVALGDGLGPLTDAVRARARSEAAAARLRDLVDQDSAVAGVGRAPVSNQSHPSLQVRQVEASWIPGGRRHLGPVSLQVAPGDSVAIVGPNGSGKSTLLAVLARHLDPVRGTYRFDGTAAPDLDLEQTRSRIAVVDDEPHVFATTLRENLRLATGGEVTDTDLEAALRRAGLGAWYEQLPDGLDTRLGTGYRGVSGGERARLAVARAVASRRPVVLLDEPVAHLDHATALRVLADLVDATMDRTVVMVSHRPDGLDGFDQIRDLTHAAPVETGGQP